MIQINQYKVLKDFLNVKKGVVIDRSRDGFICLFPNGEWIRLPVSVVEGMTEYFAPVLETPKSSLKKETYNLHLQIECEDGKVIKSEVSEKPIEKKEKSVWDVNEERKEFYKTKQNTFEDFPVKTPVKIICVCQDMYFFSGEEYGTVIGNTGRYLGITVEFREPRHFKGGYVQKSFNFDPCDLVNISKQGMATV